MPINPGKLSFNPSIAGVWQYVDPSHVTATNNGNIANSFFSTAKLGPSQKEGVILTGWQYSGFSNRSTDVTPVNLGILGQQADGTLRLETGNYVSSASTNGGGSVVVADFNADGRDDVFLGAHNESPFVSKASTVLMSNSSGTFTKLTLPDRVMAHDAQLAMLNGRPAVITASFHDDRPGGGHPVYSWNGSGFAFYEGPQLTNSSFMSMAVADFNGDGRNEIVLGDLLFGPGYAYSASNKFKIGIYDFSSGDIGAAPLAVITPYFEARAQYANVSSYWGPANTHAYRVWVDDFNHDGRPDIVSGQSLWTTANRTWPSALQMLQNQGDMRFADMSDVLNTRMSTAMDELDYELQMVDLDNSGINSYLSATRSYNSDSRQANYLLVNDGTGKLHVALHDEFVALGRKVNAYAGGLYNNPAALSVNPNGPTPKFQGYLTADGKLNYVAEVGTYQLINGNTAYISSVMVNVPLSIDIRRDFTTPIDISDRNGSKLMRTFAGNDSISQANAASSTSIDGGLGIDTAIYSGLRASYVLAKNNATFTVGGTGLADSLVNIERLRFSDKKLAIDLDGHAGTTAKLLGAVFGRLSVANKEYVGIGLSLLDAGTSYAALMQLALNAQLGRGASDTAVVNLLYTNVVGVAPSAAVRATFVELLSSGAHTHTSLGILAADTGENQANVNLAGLSTTGIEYL